MNPTNANLLESLNQCQGTIDSVLRQTNDPPRRALLFAGLLHTHWPGLFFIACSLRNEEEVCISVLDQSGQQQPEWGDELKHALLALKEKSDFAIQQWPELAQVINAKDPEFAVIHLDDAGCSYGHLVLALAHDTASLSTDPDRFWFMSCGRILALRLALEQSERESQARLADLKVQSGLATVGDLASPIVHDFNNYLNTILLHLAVLEMEVPPEKRRELAEIRHQSKEMANLIKRYQQLRRNQIGNYYPVDVNHIIWATVQQLALHETPSSAESFTYSLANGGSLVLSLTPERPCMEGSESDLQRLGTLLVSNAIAAGGQRIAVTTKTTPTHIRLIIEDSGPRLATDALNQLFDLSFNGREGTNSLELAACRSLIRRLQGTTQAENHSQGLRIVVEFPRRSETDSTTRKDRA